MRQYDKPDSLGYVTGVQEFLKIVNLTDQNAPVISNSFKDNEEYLPSQPSQVLFGKSLPFGTWNVTITALDDDDVDHFESYATFTAIGAFTYTSLTQDEVNNLDSDRKLPAPSVPYVTNPNVSTALQAAAAASEAKAQKSLTTGVIGACDSPLLFFPHEADGGGGGLRSRSRHWRYRVYSSGGSLVVSAHVLDFSFSLQRSSSRN